MRLQRPVLAAALRRCAGLRLRRARTAQAAREEGAHARRRRQGAALLPAADARRAAWLLQGAGLDVTITDFGGGAKSLQALIGGSADVVTGAYEHTIRMQAKGQPIAP